MMRCTAEDKFFEPTFLVLVSQDWGLISLGLTIMVEIFYPGFSGLVLPSSLCWQHRQDSGFGFCHHRFLKHRQDLVFWFSQDVMILLVLAIIAF